MNAKISTELKQKLIALCDGTRSRRTVANKTGLHYDHVRSYAVRHPELNLKFLTYGGNRREPQKSALSRSEGEINDLLMQPW